ncbi:hypothetical protein [Streptomyces guryensis]|uniref:Lipoprotein n=1 Tax=Streptomyces guryensis TaxID=2886947 RepID=A0A9Q3VYZ6_9ACTN|nr:hypothetical protein [Streptomyces guryensis]MCD9880189.1 hypothetical protein [Streptomyces guryensis]
MLSVGTAAAAAVLVGSLAGCTAGNQRNAAAAPRMTHNITVVSKGAAGAASRSSGATVRGSAPGASSCPGRPRTSRYVSLSGHDTHQDAVELIVRPGQYVCADKSNLDAARFTTTGPEQTVVIWEDAQISATTPVVSGNTGQPISLQRLLTWLDGHQGTLAVFTYQTDEKGRISRLDEVYNG